MDIISLHHIYKNDGSHSILKNVNMNIKRGEIYGLIGRNQAGKTSLLKVILGLTSYQAGQFSIAGSYQKKSIRQNRKKIGFFIEPDFFDYLTIKENLYYDCLIKGVDDKQEINRVLNIVGIHDDSRLYSELPVPIQHRLAFARALIGHPDILILDEPLHGLDAETSSLIRKLILQFHQQGMTIIISSHILNEIEHIATRYGIMEHGTIIKEISQEDLKTQKETIHISLKDYEKACHLLQDNDIPILESSLSYKSIEDYYLEIIGGHLHD